MQTIQKFDAQNAYLQTTYGRTNHNSGQYRLSNQRRRSWPPGDTRGLLLLDLDNTLTDTRRWFADTILTLTSDLATQFSVAEREINSLFAEVAEATTLHEYAFVVEVIASRLGVHREISFKRIKAIAHSFWTRFLDMHENIELYGGTLETLRAIRRQFPRLDIVILTDSPEWIALERLSKVGILPLIDGVVAIRTQAPRLRHGGYQRCVRRTRHRIEQRQSSIDTEHLKLNLSVPSSFAKPSSHGIELAAQRLALGPDSPIIIVGDKDSKEGQAAQHWQKRKLSSSPSEIYFVRAEYGNHDISHPRYAELAGHISSLKLSARNQVANVKLHRAIDSFAEIGPLLSDILALHSPE